MRDFTRMPRKFNRFRLLSRLTAVAVVLSLAAVFPVQPALGASSDAIQKELDRVAAQYGKIETQLAETETKQADLARQQEEAQAIIAEKSAALRARAGHMYKTGGASTMLGELLTSNNFSDFIKRIQFMETLGGHDAQLMEELRVAQSRHDDVAGELNATEERQQNLARDLRTQRDRLEGQFAEAKKVEDQKRRAAAEALKARQLSASRRAQLTATATGAPRVSSAGRFAKFTLPVRPAGFADTWGAPRSGGRRHQGTDVMAPCGAPVYAVTDGTIQRTSSGGLGGISLYLRANNGDVFYYTHLRGFVNGSAPGKRVSAGDHIAVNGNTGNARGGPCHVHFEWKPSGGRSVNPYPLLNSAR